jgi:hypothetical protein
MQMKIVVDTPEEKWLRKANRYRFCKAATEEPAKEGAAVGKDSSAAKVDYKVASK